MSVVSPASAIAHELKAKVNAMRTTVVDVRMSLFMMYLLFFEVLLFVISDGFSFEIVAARGLLSKLTIIGA